MIHLYRESVLSQLYPGNQHSSHCLVPAVLAFEDRLALPAKYRAKVLWRIDQGFGGDENINWLLERGYGVLAKGCSNRRSANLPSGYWMSGNGISMMVRMIAISSQPKPIVLFK